MNLLRLALFLLLSLAGAATFMAAAPAPPAPHAPVTVSFDPTMQLVFVEVSVNGSAPLPFLLDTGFDTNVVDAEVARRLRLKITDPQAVPVPGGTLEIGSLEPVRFGLGALSTAPLPAQAAPLAGLQPVIGRPLAGILGHAFISRFVITLDYARGSMAIADPQGFHPPSKATALPVDIIGAEPFVQVRLKPAGAPAVTGRFKVDTGSTDIAGLNKNFTEDNRLVLPRTPTVLLPGTAAGGETQGYIFRAQWIELAGFRFPQPVIGVTTDSKGFENRADAGTIGGALLSRFIMTLDFSRARMYLRPQPGSGTLSADHLGARLFAEGEAWNTVLIASVAAGSPASQAGLAPKDEVVSIDGKPASSLAAVWKTFQRGGKRRLKVRRGGKLLDVVVHARPLLPPAGP